MLMKLVKVIHHSGITSKAAQSRGILSHNKSPPLKRNRIVADGIFERVSHNLLHLKLKYFTMNYEDEKRKLVCYNFQE